LRRRAATGAWADLGRGAQSGHAPQDAKVALFCLAYAMHYINLCSKANEIYNQYMHFKGFSCPKKCLLPRLCPGDRPLPKKFTFVLGFRPQFLALEASSPLVTPISGYAYIRISNNKPQITPEASTPCKCSKKKYKGGFLGKLKKKFNIIIVLHF